MDDVLVQQLRLLEGEARDIRDSRSMYATDRTVSLAALIQKVIILLIMKYEEEARRHD